MRDYDAELAKLEERKREVRREKAMAERRRDAAIGKELRKIFPDVPDDAGQLRQFFSDMGCRFTDDQTTEKTADDYAHSPYGHVSY